MPGFDQRGPMNEGPMTGRQAGRCSVNMNYENTASVSNSSFGIRPGLGRGRRALVGRRGFQGVRWGWGMVQRSNASSDCISASEDTLNRRAQQLRSELEAIKNELRQIDE